MDTQTVDPALESYVTTVNHRPVPRQRQQLEPVDPVATPPTGRVRHGRLPERRTTPVDEIDQMANDYERARFCRTRAETYRDRWFAGRAREIAHVLGRAAAGDLQFKHMTADELEVVGRSRWSHSQQAKKLAGLEERYIRWAEMYLAFAEFQLPVKHRRTPSG